jgi:hypothetical protein
MKFVIFIILLIFANLSIIYFQTLDTFTDGAIREAFTEEKDVIMDNEYIENRLNLIHIIYKHIFHNTGSQIKGLTTFPFKEMYTVLTKNKINEDGIKENGPITLKPDDIEILKNGETLLTMYYKSFTPIFDFTDDKLDELHGTEKYNYKIINTLGKKTISSEENLWKCVGTICDIVSPAEATK